MTPEMEAEIDRALAQLFAEEGRSAVPLVCRGQVWVLTAVQVGFGGVDVVGVYPSAADARPDIEDEVGPWELPADADAGQPGDAYEIRSGHITMRLECQQVIARRRVGG